MATDPKKTEHVRDIAGTGERDSRPGEAFERAASKHGRISLRVAKPRSGERMPPARR